MSLQITLEFLRELRENNSKEWFDAHRKHYDAARKAFEDLVANLIAGFSAVDDLPPLDPKDAIHRINRDVRFSNDKSPYNTVMSALIGPEGRKSLGKAYYVRVAPDGESMAASGAFALTDAELFTVRQAIAEDARPLRNIIDAPMFQQMFGGLTGEQVKTAPRGFAKDHPEIDLLRYKEFMAQRAFSDVVATQADFPDQVIATFQAAKPLTLYFHELLGVRIKPEMHKHS
ncbi:MAG: DUF2461 domain-containing protein [Pleurocapsa minor GSE-CHR-MK-17-07R]|jgi:uncharacterized protein (TIGR02453 family)|nr:DUF2461 domain-containing protein [Pleurocapsa minor GSE-CHR-MK 17-07R]